MSKTLIIDNGSHRCLLREAVAIDQEASKNPNIIGILEGVCSDFSEGTRNNNFYSRKLWENVLASDYYKEAINTGTLLGELDHPEERLEISAQEAAIRCTKLWIDESQNCLMGRFDILNTPKGQILNVLSKAGAQLGISSRGVGDLEPSPEGYNRVVEDTYLFVCFDAVVQPAAIKARQKYTSLTESEKKNFDSVIDVLIDSVNNASDESGVKFVEGLAKRLQLNENQQLKKVIQNRKNNLKKDENNNIIKTNERLRVDLEEAYKTIRFLEAQLEKDSVSADLSFLRSQIVNIKKLIETEHNDILSEYQKITESNNQLREKTINLSRDLESATESVTHLTNQNEELQKEITLKENKIVELGNKVDYAVKFVGNVKKSFKLMEAKNAEMKKKLEDSEFLLESALKERDSYRKDKEASSKTLKALKESITKERDYKRLLESFLIEYLEQKEKYFGIDLTSARSRLNEVKSLRDIDLIVTESLKDTKRPNPNRNMERIVENKQEIPKSDAQSEDGSLVGLVMQQFYKKN